VQTAVEETAAWIDEAGAEASTEDLKDRRKTLESIVNPVMEKLYKAGGGGAGGGPAGGKEEDVDTEL
jgi:hypothetical protein